METFSLPSILFLFSSPSSPALPASVRVELGTSQQVSGPFAPTLSDCSHYSQAFFIGVSIKSKASTDDLLELLRILDLLFGLAIRIT